MPHDRRYTTAIAIACGVTRARMTAPPRHALRLGKLRAARCDPFANCGNAENRRRGDPGNRVDERCAHGGLSNMGVVDDVADEPDGDPHGAVRVARHHEQRPTFGTQNGGCAGQKGNEGHGCHALNTAREEDLTDQSASQGRVAVLSMRDAMSARCSIGHDGRLSKTRRSRRGCHAAKRPRRHGPT